MARRIHEIDNNIKIIFVTAYEQYALEAFEIDAVGYLLKPYGKEKLEKQLEKAGRIKDIPKKQVYIQTMPRFEVYIDGQVLEISRKKSKELLALMVHRQGTPVTAGMVISCLWEDRPYDDSTKTLYRMTLKRLKDFLTLHGIDFILNSEQGHKAVCPDKFQCDYYSLIAGDQKAKSRYRGEYMAEYSWAEETNAWIEQQIVFLKSK